MAWLKRCRRTRPDQPVERIHFDHLILATGARERFLPFPGWTLPGVFGAGGLQALVRAGYPIAGKRVVVAGPARCCWPSPPISPRRRHRHHRCRASALLKLAPFAASLWRQPSKLMQGARYRATLRSTSYRTGCWVVEAIPAQTHQLSAVRLTDGKRTWTEPCDLLACGYHLVPNTEIAELLGCAFDPASCVVDAQQRTSIPNIYCVGEPTGIAGLDAAIVQGEIAGLAVCREAHNSPCARVPSRSAPSPKASSAPSPCAKNCALFLEARHNRLPLRRCPLRQPPRPHRMVRHQAANPLRHGPLPGTRLRSSHRIPLELQARIRTPAALSRALRALCSAMSPRSQVRNRNSRIPKHRGESMNWSGVMPAMTTPFTPDMKVDHPFLAQHAAWQLGNGCVGLIMLGSLGEGATLEHSEKIDILKTAVRVAGKLPVVASISALSTESAVKLAKEAEASAAPASWSSRPTSTPPTGTR
jgi:hypothetical protein